MGAGPFGGFLLSSGVGECGDYEGYGGADAHCETQIGYGNNCNITYASGNYVRRSSVFSLLCIGIVRTSCFTGRGAGQSLRRHHELGQLDGQAQQWIRSSAPGACGVSCPYCSYYLSVLLIIPQFDPLQQWLPKETVLKADQWVLLARRHAVDVLRLVDAVRAQGFDLFEPFQKVGEIVATLPSVVHTALCS